MTTTETNMSVASKGNLILILVSKIVPITESHSKSCYVCAVSQNYLKIVNLPMTEPYKVLKC